MKELSIEEKAQRYDEAIKVAKDSFNYPDYPRFIRADVVFPELKESEDESIRKELLSWLKSKDGQTLPIDRYNAAIAWLEKQGEQKPAYKAEPKFRKGEWITNGDNTWKIVEVKPLDYILQSQDGNIVDDTISFVDKHFHSFTIKDARDGDVLCCESGWTCIFKALNSDISFSSYFFMDNTGWFCETGSESHTLEKAFIKTYNGNIHPATKAQRDTLMKAMADAGYTFDFDNKELKELAHQETSEWSEEDENMRIKILEALSAYADHVQYTGFCANAELIRGELMVWLKSLRPQKQWKPTQEQLDALKWQVENVNESSWYYKAIKELYNQLKEL